MLESSTSGARAAVEAAAAGREDRLGVAELGFGAGGRIAALRRKLERSEAELAKMKRVVEIQGNLSALLEQMLGTESASGSTER